MTGAITIIMGRATKDPSMQQGKNSGSEYITMDLAVSQRNQEGKDETMYYQCYFNSFLAQRLIKAGVRKGTGILVYGDLELYPFTYQQGQKAGQPGVNAKITVKDWQFTLSNKQEGTSPTVPNQIPNGNPMTNTGNNFPPYGGQPNQGFSGGNTPNAQGTHMNYQATQPHQNSYPAGVYQSSMLPGTATPNYGMMQNASPNDGFSGITENFAGQLPFN